MGFSYFILEKYKERGRDVGRERERWRREGGRERETGGSGVIIENIEIEYTDGFFF